MPRCNLTLKQKCQIIELSSQIPTEQIAKKFHVHPTTVTRTLRKKKRILEQASRVNTNYKTVQTNKKSEEHDSLILQFIKSKQEANETLTIEEICDKAIECAKTLDRELKSKRGWWRRFKIRCNIIRTKLPKQTNQSGCLADNMTVAQRDSIIVSNGSKKKSDKKGKSKRKQNNFTFRIKESIPSKQQAKTGQQLNSTQELS